MTSIIRILTEETINQIAAGEVIENPASVIKELIENAIDAGASRITIETRGGGQHLIRIDDDGCGMTPDDAVLCLERHATSKLQKPEDLFSLDTMGFRGEALASIASISRLTLTTASTSQIGTRVEVEGGKIIKTASYARALGSTVEVRSLFYNVPARKKFQKNASINASEITKVVSVLALAHPRIGFTLTHQDAEIFSFSSKDADIFDDLIYQRAKKLISDEFTSSCFKISARQGPFHILGFASDPMLTRNNRLGQYLFINKRPVFCPAISNAIKEGYGTRIAQNRFPIYVLHLEIPKHLVDVNVHPQKKEVRLTEERLIKEKIQESIRLGLDQNISPNKALNYEGASFSSFSFSPSFQETANVKTTLPLSFREDQESDPLVLPLMEEVRAIGLYHSYLFLEAESVRTRVKNQSVCEGILLVDLNAAQARLIFESLVEEKSAVFQKQALLFPINITLSPASSELVQDYYKQFEDLGIELRQIAPHSFMVESAPSFMQQEEILPFVKEVFEDLSSFQTDLDHKERCLATIASRAAMARKKIFTMQEALYLFEKLLNTSSAYHCPQGKPTMSYVNNAELLKNFSKNKI